MYKDEGRPLPEWEPTVLSEPLYLDIPGPVFNPHLTIINAHGVHVSSKQSSRWRNHTRRGLF